MSGASIEFLPRGKVAPLTKLDFQRDGQPGRFDGGVYHSNGEICPLGSQLKAAYRNEPVMPAPAAEEKISGHHFFAGMLQNGHFGHFISESLSRLWAFQCLDKSFNSAVFYYRDRNTPLAKFAAETIKLIVPEVTIKAVIRPTEFELLAVPQQLAYSGNGFVIGHPMIRSMLGHLRGKPRNGEEKIYVSRSRLSLGDGGLLLEDAIERNLAAEGYEVVHPQELPVAQQIEKYNAAKHIIFADGSAIHLYALVARPDQKMFVIWRRHVDGVFAWQIRTFDGPRIEGKSCVKELWVPKNSNQGTVNGRALLDFPHLRSQLVELGFIGGGQWRDPEDFEFREALSDLGTRLKWTFVLHPRAPA